MAQLPPRKHAAARRMNIGFRSRAETSFSSGARDPKLRTKLKILGAIWNDE
jgi:hypothetical protein